MKLPEVLAAALLAAISLAPHAASATTYTIDCGAGGPTAPLQSQIDAIGSSPTNTINVIGTCVGDVQLTRADRLSIKGLSLTGTLSMDSSASVTFTNLNLTGALTVLNSRRATFNGTLARAAVTVMRGSQAAFNTLNMTSWTDSSGTQEPSFVCSGQSECTLSAATLTGSGSSDVSIGVLAASAARLNFYSGSVSGFGIGAQVWNHATAFFTSACDPIRIRSNRSTGVYATDGGLVKVEGMSAADAAASGCSGPIFIDIGSNGRYGVLADGGGNAYLFLTKITGHAIDGVRVRNGSVMHIRSSTLDAATSSGRSARVKSQAHLYFDEQTAGPAAGSTLAGPICVTDNSSVDTDNSSTVPTVVTACAAP